LQYWSKPQSKEAAADFSVPPNLQSQFKKFWG